MKSEDLFLEFAWLIKTLQKSDGMTFKALNERWVKDTEFSGGVEFNYSSLHRHFERLAAYSDDTRSPIPVISVHSVGNLQYRRQS